MSYDDLKVIEGAKFLRSIAQGTSEGATVVDGIRSARVLEAALASAQDGCWVAPTPTAARS
jgi:predicted dehydrogenase